MLQQLLHRWSGTPEEVALKVQNMGLTRAAQLVSKVLRQPAPTTGELPEWLEDVLVAVMDCLCDYEELDMPTASDCGAVDTAKEFLSGVPPQTRQEFQSLLVLIEVAPFIFGPTRRRFTELAPTDQEKSLKGWEQSPIDHRRAGFSAIKQMVMMGYWTQPETWPAIGYSIADNPGVPEPQKSQWQKREGESDEQ